MLRYFSFTVACLPRSLNWPLSVQLTIWVTILAPLSATLPPSLTTDDCDRLSAQTSATELRESLDQLAIAPQENRIAANISTLTWVGSNSTFLSATLRGDRVEQIVCQAAAAPLDSVATPGDASHMLCSQIELDMSLETVQQTLGSAGEVLLGEDGQPLSGVRRWLDSATQQSAIVAFNNFGELASVSCFEPPTAPAEIDRSPADDVPSTAPLIPN